MASFNIHLAIGIRYLEKTKSIQNEKDFFKGIIAPDLVYDKKVSHYTGIFDKQDLLKYLSKKVQLNEYLKNENIDSDYSKGVFLHLITDYLFFNNFIDYTYLSTTPYSEFCKDLYYSYYITNEYLENKYKIDYSEFIAEMNNTIEKDKKEKNTIDNEIKKNILPLVELDNFIEYVSNIDLENYKNKIIINDCNILP